MPKKFLSALILLTFCSLSVLAQTIIESGNPPRTPLNLADLQKKSEADEKLQKDAVEFLRETASEVGRLRSIENRISFSSELASLMWFHDDKEAKAMYGQVVLDFKQLLMQFDAEMNSAANPSSDDEMGG